MVFWLLAAAAGNSERHLYFPEGLTQVGCTEECSQELHRVLSYVFMRVEIERTSIIFSYIVV